MELFYLVGNRLHEVRPAWSFVRLGALTQGSITDLDWAAISALMHRCRDRPMDFADATLVHLAERESLTTILTVDVSDLQWEFCPSAGFEGSPMFTYHNHM
jgi:hypothetical protein